MVACVEEDRVRLARSHCAWRWWDPIEMELPEQIAVLCHRTLPLEDMNKNTRLVEFVRRERLSFLHGNGGVAFDGQKSYVQQQQILHL